MNKRIEELAEQCGFRSNPNVYDRNQSFDIEKFAKLIVGECASFADKHNQQKLYEDYTLGVGKAIKQHFGVKE